MVVLPGDKKRGMTPNPNGSVSSRNDEYLDPIDSHRRTDAAPKLGAPATVIEVES